MEISVVKAFWPEFHHYCHLPDRANKSCINARKSFQSQYGWRIAQYFQRAESETGVTSSKIVSGIGIKKSVVKNVGYYQSDNLARS